MIRRTSAVAGVIASLWAGAAARAAEPVDRSYAVVVSDATYADPAWRPVVDARPTAVAAR